MTVGPIVTTKIIPNAGTVPLVDRSALRRKHFDVIVIGAGVAGLAFTLSLPPEQRVALLTKGILGESSTRYARVAPQRPLARTKVQRRTPSTR